MTHFYKCPRNKKFHKIQMHSDPPFVFEVQCIAQTDRPDVVSEREWSCLEIAINISRKHITVGCNSYPLSTLLEKKAGRIFLSRAQAKWHDIWIYYNSSLLFLIQSVGGDSKKRLIASWFLLDRAIIDRLRRDFWKWKQKRI